MDASFWAKPWIGYLWVFAIFFSVFGFLPWGIYELHQHRGNNSTAQDEIATEAWFAAGVFVFMTVPISIWDVAMHLRHYEAPELQRCIIRIIWMVPIYSIDSWLALRYPKHAVYYDTVRECYEAYVIYSFYTLLLTYCRNRDPDFIANSAGRPPVKHLWPFGHCFRAELGPGFFKWVHTGPIIYVFCRIVLTFVSILCELTGTYKEGEVSGSSPWFWVTFINVFTQGWAMYCLLMFYMAFKKEIASVRPLPKLLVIKAVVFFSFYQGVAITMLEIYGVIKDDSLAGPYSTASAKGTALQDFIVCIEMFIYSIIHHYVFTHREYTIEGQDTSAMTIREALVHLFTVTDVADDVIDTMVDTTDSIADATKGAVADAKNTIVKKVTSRPTRNDHEVTERLLSPADKAYGGM